MRSAELAVEPRERRVGVRPQLRRDRLRVERTLELGDRLARVAASRERDPEPGPGPRLGDHVAVLPRVDEERAKALLGSAEVVAEPQLELSVAEAELPLLRLGDRHPGLEVLEGDAEPSREDAERLQRRVALTRFDPRNVRIRHAWSGQFSLRQSPLETEAANSRSDRLLAGRCVEVVHGGSYCFAFLAASTDAFVA